MDQQRARRIVNDIASLNQFALDRFRSAINNDVIIAADRYGLNLVMANRIGRLSHTSVQLLGALPVPLIYAEVSDVPMLCASAERSVKLPPGQRDRFEGGTDPELARLYLQLVREDAWRYDVTAAVRWSWPIRAIQRLVTVPVSALVLMADALTLKLSDSRMLRELLFCAELAPLETLPMEVRIATLTTLGVVPVSAPM